MPVDAGSIFSEVRVRLDKLTGDIKQIDSLFDQISKSSEKPKKPIQEMSFLAVAAFAAVGLAIKKLVTSAVSAFADFEQSMANVASVAKASPEGFELLTEAAKEAGEQTRFTASQAADALYYLASAGFDAQQSVSALNGVLELAGATQSDLAFTSEAVASTISQFGLDASDAAKVANIFTAAITGSQATMEKLATSMRYVGPVASAMGKSLEDVTGVLQILYNNGFEASQAGTALRSALSDLANQTSPAIAKLKELGVTFDEVNPATNSFADIFEVLQGKVTEAGDIMSIFGDRAGPAMIKLIQAGRSEIEKYTEAVTDTNAAAVAYARQNDTLKGSIDRMKSATEAAQIGFSEIFAPAIRAVVDLLTKALVALNKLPAPLKILVVGIGLGIPAVIALTVAIQALLPTLAAMGAAIATVALPITAIVGGLAALGAGIYAIKKAHDASELRQIKLDYGDLATQLKLTTEEMRDLVKAQKGIGDNKTIEQINNMRIALGLTTEEFKKLVNQANRWNFVFGTSKDLFILAKTEMGLTAIEAKNLDNAFAAINKSSDFTDLDKNIEAVAEKLSLSKEQVIKLALSSEKVTGNFRQQLKVREDQRALEEQIYEADAKTLKSLWERSKIQSRNADETERELQAAKDLEALRRKGVIEGRGEALAATAKALDELNRKYKDGFIAQEEYQKGINEAYKKEIESLYGLGYQIDQIDSKTGNMSEGAKRLKVLLDELSEAMNIEERQKALDDYNEKLRALTDETYNAIEAERERALVGVEVSSQLYDAINKYYDALRDKSAPKEMVDNMKAATDKTRGFFADLFSNLMKQYKKQRDETLKTLTDVKSATETIRSFFVDLFLGLGDLAQANADKQIAEIDRQLQAALEAAGVQEQTAIEKAQAEYDAAVTAGDAELAAEKLRELQRLQITDEFEKKKRQIEYKSELLSWQYKMAGLFANAAGAIVKNFLDLGFVGGLIANAAMAIPIGIQAASLAAQEPVPPAFDTGGLVIPSGGSGKNITVAENGYPEMMMNSGPEGRPFMEEFANILAAKINGGGGKGTLTVIFEDAGRRIAESSAAYYNNGIVRVKLK